MSFVNQELEDFIKRQVTEVAIVLGKSAPEERKRRVRDALAGRPVDPPLTDLERDLIQTIQRLRADQSKSPVTPPLSAKERDLSAIVLRLQDELTAKTAVPPLTDEERDLRQTLERARERLREGLAQRSVQSPLTDSERADVLEIEQSAAMRAVAILRQEENRRIHEIRQIVIASVNNRPVKIDHIVEGGPLSPGDPIGEKGVVVGYQTRLGRVSLSKPSGAQDTLGSYRLLDPMHRGWRDEDDKVQCIVLLRKGEDSPPALDDVRKKVEELNDPESGRMLPGVHIETYYDRGDLTDVTTETVEENLFLGMMLVVAVLLMFISKRLGCRGHRRHQYPLKGAAVRIHLAVLPWQIGESPIDSER